MSLHPLESGLDLAVGTLSLGSLERRVAAALFAESEAESHWRAAGTIAVSVTRESGIAFVETAHQRNLPVVAIVNEVIYPEKIALHKLERSGVRVIRLPAEGMRSLTPSLVTDLVARVTAGQPSDVPVRFLLDPVNTTPLTKAVQAATAGLLGELKLPAEVSAAIAIGVELPHTLLSTLIVQTLRERLSVAGSTLIVAELGAPRPGDSDETTIRVAPSDAAIAQSVLQKQVPAAAQAVGLLTGAALVALRSVSHPHQKIALACDGDAAVSQAPPSTNPASKYRGAAVEDLNLPVPVTASQTIAIGAALALMDEHDFDNLPVLDAKKRLVGLLTREKLEARVRAAPSTAEAEQVTPAMYYSFSRKHRYVPIQLDTPLEVLEQFFTQHSIAFVTDDNGWCVSLATPADLQLYLSKRIML
ncbi:hypothetical protein CAOG_01099, partial [Capsaspora owczarzaki ATCC 30864]|uniref:CBS domain-containing protein n=1 Tax=Capsaspora owczarzaki (strain ATCC 30864) TaxID=595528 RepID=A0A0D2X0U4_CAPO3